MAAVALGVRQVASSTGIVYTVYERPEEFAALVERATREARIWLDTEIADWNTKSPRLSLIQLRLGDGSLHVVDVLADGMRAVYEERFRPAVVLSPSVEKWAHYARFERRVFGLVEKEALNCTFDLARGVPYHRLPLRSLRLAKLVHHFFGVAVDKTFQKTDWGRRPLTPEELDYAAWDPEWCYRIHDRLRELVRSWDPAREDPSAVADEYVATLPALRDATQWRAAMWDVIKAFMVAGENERFSDFLLQTRVIRSVPIPALANVVREVDPTGTAEFVIPVSAAVLRALVAGGEEVVRAGGHEVTVVRFNTPRAPRAPEKPTYDLDPEAPDRVAAEFASADHEHRSLESSRQELKDRMRAWMEHTGVRECSGFEITDTSRRLSADVRLVADWLALGPPPPTGLPSRFLSAFSPTLIRDLSEYVDARATPTMRWRPETAVLPLEIAQSREWSQDAED